MDELFTSKQPLTLLVELFFGFFGGYTDVFLKACDSFEKLKGDNSVLAMRRMGDGKGRVSCWKMGT